MKAKDPRSTTRRSQARAYFVRENACWDAGTARLLLRLPRGRAQGPVFATHRGLARGSDRTARCAPGHSLARFFCAQVNARAPLLGEHTAVRGPSTGWDLYGYRRCALTQLGGQGASLLCC